MPYVVRTSRLTDGPTLRAIERLAGERFRTVGLASVADDEPPSLEEFARHAIEGTSWSVFNEIDECLGYVLVDEVDGNVHVDQMSVRPDYQGRGLGRLLVERVERWSLEIGRSKITLTTFSEVEWNRPLYEHLGFKVMTEEEIGPELHAIRAVEAIRGLGMALRVCMSLNVY